jgi:hypothetical protein
MSTTQCTFPLRFLSLIVIGAINHRRRPFPPDLIIKPGTMECIGLYTAQMSVCEDDVERAKSVLEAERVFGDFTVRCLHALVVHSTPVLVAPPLTQISFLLLPTFSNAKQR